MPVETSRTKLVSLRVPHGVWDDIVAEASRTHRTRTDVMIARLGGKVTTHMVAPKPTPRVECGHLQVRVLSYGVFCAACGAKVR